MKGTKLKQINNLIITVDNEAGLYRVYSPDGVELYSDPMRVMVEQKCRACTDYLKKSNKNKEVSARRYIKFNYRLFDGDIDEPNTYSIIVELNTSRDIRPLYKVIMGEIAKIKDSNNAWQFEILVNMACKRVLTKEGIKWSVIRPDLTIDVED